MEPDPVPESSDTIQTKITNSDIKKIIGVPKKKKRQQIIYYFSKKVIIFVGIVTTIIYVGAHYFSII
jgi:hypothetical protein